MRILLTGATGQLGAYLLDELTAGCRHEVLAWSRSPLRPWPGVVARQVDLADARAVAELLDRADPDVILHAAAISSAEAVRAMPELSWTVNVAATRQLADWCQARGRGIVLTSTDLVFDGERSRYREQDSPSPVLEYGRTKAAAEPLVTRVPRGLVARLSLLFGGARTVRETYYDRVLGALAAGRPQAFFEDEYRTPLHYSIAARALVRLVEVGARGIVHVGGKERLSRFELMGRVAAARGIDPALVTANRRSDVATAEPRPADVSLDTSLLERLVPDLDRPPVETVAGAAAGRGG